MARWQALPEQYGQQHDHVHQAMQLLPAVCLKRRIILLVDDSHADQRTKAAKPMVMKGRLAMSWTILVQSKLIEPAKSEKCSRHK